MDAPRREDAPIDEHLGGPLAAIDMGSNSFRLELGQIVDGRYRRIDYLKETVRLGAGLDGGGRLTEEAALRGLACLATFAQRLKGFGPRQVRAVATQTLREARNRDAFLARAQGVLGRPIEVISGREEARLTFLGVARLHPSSARRLVIDIGGRSTEMILGREQTARVAESFQIGCVGLSMRHFPDARFSEAGFRAAQVAAGAELEEAFEPFAREHWDEALGSSGTVSAVSQILLANGITDGRITPLGLRWLIERCLEAGRFDKLALPGLKDDRKPVLAGGLAILYTLAAHFRIDALAPARGALRQGVIFDLDERLQALREHDGRDIRDASVRELQRRFRVDAAQAGRVGAVAAALHAQAQPKASVDAQRELAWACALHEIGMMVSHHDHHRHSAYLLAHVDAPGFSQSQQRRLGELVLGQRGGLRKLEASLQREEFAWQVLALRLAVIACHARSEAEPGTWQLARHGTQATLAFAPGWVENHLRASYLLQQEAEAWDRSPAAIALVLKT